MDSEPRHLTRRRRNEHWGVEPDPELEDQLEDVTGAYEVVNRRRILWRDSAFILIGVILALLLAQILLPNGAGTGTGDPTEFPTGAALGLTFAPRTPAPGETFGPILDPDLGIDATPRPSPVITLGPTRRPVTIPSATPGASPSPRITPKAPTAPPPPTAPPTDQPTPDVTPTPAPPPPTVEISCQVPALSMTVTCSSSSTHIRADSQVWDPGGTGTQGGGGNTTASIEWTYDLPGVYTVQLTVTGDDGSTASDQATVTVPGL
jgi:surface-anchored protein